MARLVPPSPISEEPKIWTKWGGSGKGIEESIGVKWTTGTTPVAGSYIRQFAYCGNGIVVGGSNSGHMARSTDYGLTWVDLGVPITGCTAVYSIAYLGNGILIAAATDATGGRIIRSSNYGLTWAANSVVSTNGWGSTYLGPIVYCGNGIVIMIDSLAYEYRSTDYGVTFITFAGQMAAGSIPRGGCYCGDGIIVMAGQTYFHRSVDYGLNWVEAAVPAAVIANGFYPVTYVGNGRVVMFGNGGYPAVSDDYGQTWRMATTAGVTGLNTYGAVDCGDGVLVGCQRSQTGATQAVHVSHDWGETWAVTGVGVGTETILYSPCYLENGIVIVCASSGVVYRSIAASADEVAAGTRDLSHHTTATGATTLTTSHGVICVSTATSRNITLPSAATCDGRRYVIKRIGATANAHVALMRSGGDTIDGATNITITTTKGAREIIADGTNNRWLVINEVD